MNRPPWQPLPPATHTPLPTQADVVIIGSDLAGLACATALARAGAQVVLLDQREANEIRSAGRACGILVPGLAESAHRLLEVLGEEDCSLLFQLARSSIQRLKALNCFEPTGVVLSALSEPEAESLAADLECYRTLGWSSEAFVPSPQQQPPAHWPGVVLHEAGQFNPQAALAALTREAHSHGVQQVHGVQIQDVDEVDEGIRIQSSAGVILSELVVHTSGWNMVDWLPWAREKLYPVRLQHLCIETPGASSMQPTILQYGHSWARSTPEGTLLTGGCRWASPHLEVGEHDEQNLSETVELRVIARAHALFDLEESLPIVHRWAQIATYTCDGLPFIGTLPGSARQIVCTGWNGRPWSMALTAGERVAAEISGEETEPLPTCVNTYRMV